LTKHHHTITKPAHKKLHPRNIHNTGYDFQALISSSPRFEPYVKKNAYGNLSIDFADPAAVKALNAALLKHDYGIDHWDIPDGALCPPIPGRVDYVHYVAELLGESAPKAENTKQHAEPKILDIGTGANGIYALLSSQIYHWSCVASDINPQSLDNVETILSKNPQLKGQVELRLQKDKNHMFEGIIQKDEFFDASVCNPPFHASLEEALKGSQRKLNNLARNRRDKAYRRTKSDSPTLNFGGEGAELWCKGGELLFIKKLIKESQTFAEQCRWFTCLVSKGDNVKPAIKLIQRLGAKDVKEIEMQQGNKLTRILAWTYL